MRELDGVRVLVVGAAGFVGANLVRALLDAGAHVSGVVRPGGSRARLSDVEEELELVAVDVRDVEALGQTAVRVRPELAVNLAVASGHPASARDRLALLETSVLGTAGLVEALAGKECTRLVHIGSSLEYGPRPRPLSEADRPAPTVPRGAAKAAATLACLAWGRTLGVPACVLRPFRVYGPWEAPRRFVPAALRAAVTGAELPLTEPGIVRDYVYVGDVVEAILLALGDTADVDGQIVNVGSGTQTTNEELVAAVERVAGRPVRTRPGAYPRAAHDTSTWVADVRRARRVLGWEPRTPLEEGLRHTLSWVERELVAR